MDTSHSQLSIPMSVIIMTKNEEKNIEKCLASVARFAQVFVVDSHSDDQTCTLADGLGAQVVPFSWDGKYPKKKQWCLQNLPFEYDWVLYVDADEEVTEELADELAKMFASGPTLDGYFVAFNYVFLDTVLQYGHRVFKLAMFNRHKGRFVDYDDLDVANMWEVEGHYQPHVEGNTGSLTGRMIHRDADNLFHYFDRHNRYSDWEAMLRQKNALVAPTDTQPGARLLLKKAFEKLPLKGVVAFAHSYLLMRGFLDGRAGFHFALARAFYYWQIGIKQGELARRGGQ